MTALPPPSPSGDVTYLCAGGQQVDEVDEVSEVRLTLLALQDGLARVTWLVEHVRDLVVVLQTKYM